MAASTSMGAGSAGRTMSAGASQHNHLIMANR